MIRHYSIALMFQLSKFDLDAQIQDIFCTITSKKSSIKLVYLNLNDIIGYNFYSIHTVEIKWYKPVKIVMIEQREIGYVKHYNWTIYFCHG